jgi:hypothetical protein
MPEQQEPTGSGSGAAAAVRSFLSSAASALVRPFDGSRFKPEVRSDPSRRPAGWAGHWSTEYGAVLARTLATDPPFERPTRDVLASAPQPLRETLDPAASTAESTDRDGRRLPWRWVRSATHDLLGPYGVVLGGLTVAIVLSALILTRLDLPPLLLSRDGPQSPVQQNSTNPAPATDLQNAPQFPAQVELTDHAQSNQTGNAQSPSQIPAQGKLPDPTQSPRKGDALGLPQSPGLGLRFPTPLAVPKIPPPPNKPRS